MNHFDQASRFAAKLDAAGYIAWLLGGPSRNLTFVDWLDARRLPFPGNPDRTGDTVARLHAAAEPERFWALAIEFQSEPDGEMFGRLLVYAGMIWLELRPSEERGARYAVMTAVVNLTGRGQSGRDMALAGGRTCLQPLERNLCDEDAFATLTQIEAGITARCLLPWIPLMQGGDAPGIIQRWKELALAEADSQCRGEYAGLALVFAEAAGCKPIWKDALKGWNMKQSEQVLEWMAEGRMEGLAEGELKGRVEGEVKALLKMLAARLSVRVPADLVELIRTTATEEKLDRWLEAAARTTSLDDFRFVVEQNGV